MCTISEKSTQPARPKAYILGPSSSTRAIATELQELGFTTVAVEQIIELPSPHEPGAIDRTKQILADLCRLANSDRPVASGPDCLHPGISPWGERAELPVIAQELGLVTLSPPASALTLFANNLNLLTEAERLGIPNLVLSFDPLHGVREIERFLIQRRLSFPIVFRSVHFAGYFGKNIVRDYDDFEKKLGIWIEQLHRNIGEDLVFAETHLDGARQLSLPFARSKTGEIVFFKLIDCSLQARSRKIVEICPASAVAGGVDPETDLKIKKWAQRLIEHSRFTGVGSLEFLVDGSKAFLIGGKARLSSSFHLWETVCGTSAVRWQLAILQNDTNALSALQRMHENLPVAPGPTGVAVHLLAEDSLLQLPQAGFISETSEARKWEFPGSQAELWLDVAVNTEISGPQHGKLGVLYVTGQDLKQIVTIARGILTTEIWLAGALQTNERFVSELLEHPWVREGIFHTGFVDQEFTPRLRPEWVSLFASLCASHPDVAKAITPGTRWIVGDQWAKAEPAAIRWVKEPQFFRKSLGFPGVSGKILLPDGQSVSACAYPIAPISLRRWQVRIGQWVLNTKLVPPIVPGASRSPKLLALVQGRIHSLLYRPGSIIGAHEVSVIIESLGYLIPHSSPRAFRILHWKVEPDQVVCSGQELAEIDFTELS